MAFHCLIYGESESQQDDSSLGTYWKANTCFLGEKEELSLAIKHIETIMNNLDCPRRLKDCFTDIDKQAIGPTELQEFYSNFYPDYVQILDDNNGLVIEGTVKSCQVKWNRAGEDDMNDFLLQSAFQNSWDNAATA